MFIDPSRFSFVADLESDWQTIREELVTLPSDAFDPWVQRQMHGDGWSVYGLFAMGKKIKRACQACPKTAGILSQIPGVSLAGFSRLAAKTHIKPHVGWAKSVYRLHLGLIVPDECGLRVGSETKNWVEGKCLVFDDTVEHEAWNQSDHPRSTLMLDFLRPGITDFSGDNVPDEVRAYVSRLELQ